MRVLAPPLEPRRARRHRGTNVRETFDVQAIAHPMNASVWLQSWDAQGIHRTGTEGDTAGADWLAREAASMGAKVSIETFSLSRIDPVSCWLETKDGRIEGIPVFDSSPTGPEGIAGHIGVMPLSPQAVYTPDYRAMRHASDTAALVIVCQGTEPGLGLLNAEQFRTPHGCPAIHVAVAPDAEPLRVISNYRRTEAAARNVVVTIPGRARARPPVVVMTPRSSWWQSTSERGGGLVCWLETLRSLIETPPSCDVVMTANSGHELGHLGLDAFLERRSGWDHPGGAIWVHYGANIGARGGKLSIQSADGPLREAMRLALTEAGQPPDTVAPETLVPSGETRDIHRMGGRYVTLVGSNPLFHLPQDRWPRAVDLPAIERAAAGAAAMVRALTR
ncbi:MAG: hypothetical protein EXR07_03105 [Acetobacteraceae bacterium]|nr:hypothetical protein [Acetobacteraceae bacterium]